MPELVLELYTEEIPALMQKKAEEAYHAIFTKAFEVEEIIYQALELHVTPRRLVLHVSGLPEKSLAKHIEIKGPKINAPSQAIDGFCRANNISKEELKVKNQDYYVYEFVKPEVSIAEILPALLTKSISEYVWPKSMHWGTYEMKWVRPMLNIMCIFNGNVLDFSYFHLKANNNSFGHRFIAFESFSVQNWEEYLKNLKKSYVVLERNERLSMITRGIREIEEEYNLAIDIDSRLLEEVAGLVEYPKVLIGSIPKKFMHVPNEILSLAMKTHQRYFTTRDKNGEFSPYFVFVSNLPEGSQDVAYGNEKVLAARLADASYFYEQDQKRTLESRLEKLKEMIFHAKLGSIHDKAMRLVKLAKYLKPEDDDLAKAALLCKCDLATEAVSEFPELQGIMGGYYAAAEGLSEKVSSAIKNHYLPLGNNDPIPDSNAAFLSLIDKADSLVNLMQAGEKATGSKDPYALRRYALGIIKLILENNLYEVSITNLVRNAFLKYDEDIYKEIVSFIEERFKYFLRDTYSLESINTAIDLYTEDNLCITLKKVEAINNFMQGQDGISLIQLYKRVTNILESDNFPHALIADSGVDEKKFTTPEEQKLYDSIKTLEPIITKYLESHDFEKIFHHLNNLTNPITAFFDKVMVNDQDPSIAKNRKLLLSSISNIFNQIARFEKL